MDIDNTKSQVYIGLTYGGLLGRVVRWFGGKFNHTLLIWAVDPEHRGTWRVLQSDQHGVWIKHFEESDLCEHYMILMAPDLPREKVDNIVYWAYGALGKIYGWESLPSVAWHMVKRWLAQLGLLPPGALDLSYVCSEFVAACFAGGGWPLFEEALVLPDDYLQLVNNETLIVIEEG